MTETNMDDVHPKLRAAVKDFLLKSRYPFEVYLTGAFDQYDLNNDRNYRIGVGFGDPKYADINHRLCGEIKLLSVKDGNVTLLPADLSVLASAVTSAKMLLDNNKSAQPTTPKKG